VTPRSPERSVVGLATAAAALGVALEAVASGAAAYALVAWTVVISVIRAPRAAVPGVLAFLVVQEPLAAHALELDKALYGALRAADEVLALAAVLRLWCLRRRGELGWVRWRDWRWAAGFVAAWLASSAVAGAGLGPTALGAFLACRFFLYLLLAWSVPWTPADAGRLLRALAACAPALLALGFVGFLLPEATEALLPNIVDEEEFSRSGLRSFRAPFLNPGVYGWACAVATLAAATLWLSTRRRGDALAALCGIVGVVVSLRRKPLVGVPLALAAALGSLTRRQKAYLAGGVAALAVAGGYWAAAHFDALVEDTVASYLDPSTREDSARGALTLGAAAIAQQHAPLGAGFGRFGSYPSVLWYSDVYYELGLAELYGFSEEHPHYILDLYWQHLLGETGYVGLACIVVWFWGLWSRVRASARALSSSPELGRIALFVTMILAEALVESMGAPIFETPLPALAIALPVGIALRLADDQAAPSGPGDERPVPHLEHEQRV
jgi:hypothetical protein